MANTPNYNLNKIPKGTKEWETPYYENLDKIDGGMKEIDTKIGDTTALQTTEKSNTVGAINELKSNINTNEEKINSVDNRVAILENKNLDTSLNYKSLLENNFESLIRGNLNTKSNTLKTITKTGTISNGVYLISDNVAKILRIYDVMQGTTKVFENVDFTIDLDAKKISAGSKATTFIEETSITWTGNWTNYPNTLFSSGTARFITEANVAASTGTFTFTGKTLYLRCRTGKGEGKIKVTIDGVVSTIDLYRNAPDNYSDRVLVKTGLTNASHNVVLEHAGSHNASATVGNYTVVVDGYEYLTIDVIDLEGKSITFKMAYLEYQGVLGGIEADEASDRFRMKVLYAPAWAYVSTAGDGVGSSILSDVYKFMSRRLPISNQVLTNGDADLKYDQLNISSTEQYGSTAKVPFVYSKASCLPIQEGMKLYVTYHAQSRGFKNVEIDNMNSTQIYEYYGELDNAKNKMVIKPFLAVVTDKCKNSNVEVGEVVLGVITVTNNTKSIDIGASTDRAIEIYKLQTKESIDMINVVAYGDSITAGTYLKNAETYPEQLEKLLNKQGFSKPINIINKGNNGDKSGDGVLTINAEVIAQKPSHVLLMFGTNDEGNAVTKATFKANMESMINSLKTANINPILVTTTAVDYPLHYNVDRNTAFLPYNEALSELATQYNVPLINVKQRFLNEIASGNWDLMVHNDGSTPLYPLINPRTNEPDFYTNIHPNPEGCRVIADEVSKTLMPLFS